jgi:murein L,D-transpeptidase YafK
MLRRRLLVSAGSFAGLSMWAMLAHADNARVRQAKANVDAWLDARYAALGLRSPQSLMIRIHKQQPLRIDDHRGDVQLWAAQRADEVHQQVASWPVCSTSGVLGPKWREGDLQVPEGIYRIDLLNPTSSYHLSMRVNYPNDVDKIRNRRTHHDALGGAIMIHGSCVTIGCVPITDDMIEQLYVAVARVNPRHTVQVHMHPCPMDEPHMAWLEDEAHTRSTQHRAEAVQLWRDLAAIWRRFEASHVVPKVVQRDGRYMFPS